MGFLSRVQPTVEYSSMSWLISVVPEVCTGVPMHHTFLLNSHPEGDFGSVKGEEEDQDI